MVAPVGRQGDGAAQTMHSLDRANVHIGPGKPETASGEINGAILSWLKPDPGGRVVAARHGPRARQGGDTGSPSTFLRVKVTPGGKASVVQYRRGLRTTRIPCAGHVS